MAELQQFRQMLTKLNNLTSFGGCLKAMMLFPDPNATMSRQDFEVRLQPCNSWFKTLLCTNVKWTIPRFKTMKIREWHSLLMLELMPESCCFFVYLLLVASHFSNRAVKTTRSSSELEQADCGVALLRGYCPIPFRRARFRTLHFDPKTRQINLYLLTSAYVPVHGQHVCVRQDQVIDSWY